MICANCGAETNTDEKLCENCVAKSAELQAESQAINETNPLFRAADAYVQAEEKVVGKVVDTFDSWEERNQENPSKLYQATSSTLETAFKIEDKVDGWIEDKVGTKIDDAVSKGMDKVLNSGPVDKVLTWFFDKFAK